MIEAKHFTIEEYKFCPNCGLDDFDKNFGCGSCGGILANPIDALVMCCSGGKLNVLT